MAFTILSFMKRNLENRKKLMPIWEKNSSGLYSKNIVSSVILGDNIGMNNGFLANIHGMNDKSCA